MARISEEEIETLRQRADIVEVISHYLQVHRSGKDYKCVCPFHDDHDPSMSISPDKQIYKCFVCGAGGNVYGFVQNYEKITFPEAVGRVAELTGFSLSVQPEKYEKPKDPHKEAIYKVLRETINYTMYQLDTPDGANEKEYLEKRGLDEETRKVFEIGYNPLGTSLSRFLEAKGYEEKDLVSANVARVNESGIHDVFAGRITFPIHDESGNPIGFSARSIDPENRSKYINTNDTDVFTKGDIVYNYHRARQTARHEGKIYVCEGVTDVIAFHRAGLVNAVCTLGTSCTDHQIRLLKKSAAKIVFCYDGDHAGQAATWRACKMARAQGCEVAIVQNKTGRDPDEIIRSDGPEALRNMVSHEISWMEFVLSFLKSETNMDSYLEKKEMVQKAKAEIDQLPDEMDRAYFADQLAEMTGFRIETAAARKPVMEDVRTETLHTLTVPNGVRKAEEMILSMMMSSAEASRAFEEELGFLVSKSSQTLALMIVDAMHSRGRADAGYLMDAAEDQGVRDLISDIAFRSEEAYDPDKMKGAMRRIKIEVLTEQARALREQLTQGLNGTALGVVLNKYNECLTEQRRLINEESNGSNYN